MKSLIDVSKVAGRCDDKVYTCTCRLSSLKSLRSTLLAAVSFLGALPAFGVVIGGVTVPGDVVVGLRPPGKRITGSCAKRQFAVIVNRRLRKTLYVEVRVKNGGLKCYNHFAKNRRKFWFGLFGGL